MTAGLLELDRRHVWHPYTPIDDPRPPLLVSHALGARVTLADGRSILDGNSSWWVAGLGHNHPRLVAALKDQADRMCHVALAGLTHEPAVRLAAELASVAPAGLTRVFYSDNGSTAIEAALKLAVQYFQQTGRPQKCRILGLGDAFHGETAGAASLGGVDVFRRASAPLLFDALHTPETTRVDEALALFDRHGHELAAVVVEPIVQGAGGMRFYPPRLLAELRARCDAHDVLLIADEVFTGYGRTGTMWACEHAGVVPDLLCTGKTFSGGLLPFAATLASERLAEAFRGGRERAFLYGHSYTGNPLGAAVARAALAVMKDEQVVEQARQKQPILLAAMEKAQAIAGGSGARALGMIGAFELGQGAYLGGAGWRVYDKALELGAYLRPLGDTIYLAPPLTISPADLSELCEITAAAVSAAI
jgi:adenosylmethionine-8-amino-7-oxononanoate aminotransferase